MPDPTWYFVGPDKTGFECKLCYAGFFETEADCKPWSCPVSPKKFRNYICPNVKFPTPHHFYSWDGDSMSEGKSVRISVNSKVCPMSSTTCWSYTAGALNAAGRFGSKCSQSTVSAIDKCSISSTSCPTPCGSGCGCVQGAIFFPQYCEITSSGCHCSNGPSFSFCGCICQDQCEDPDLPCYGGDACNNCYKDCPDGTTFEYDCGSEPPSCPCDDAPDPPDCPPCNELLCVGDVFICVPLVCEEECSAGYSCSCGQCVCNTSSTCCVGSLSGWVWNEGAKECEPCYKDWQCVKPPNWCYRYWRQKNCELATEVCCNDGRCYESDSIVCDLRAPLSSGSSCSWYL